MNTFGWLPKGGKRERVEWSGMECGVDEEKEIIKRDCVTNDNNGTWTQRF